MKIKMITHNDDLDGRSCEIVARVIFLSQIEKFDVSYETYHSMNNSINTFLDNKEYQNYDLVLITDLRISDALIERIDVINREVGGTIVYIDHHETIPNISDYPWAIVKCVDKFGEKISATKLLYENYFILVSEQHSWKLARYVELVSLYDTYLWKSKGIVEAKKLHDLLAIYGYEKYTEVMYKNLTDNNEPDFFSATDRFVLSLEEDRIRRYIKQKESEMKIYEVCGYKVAVMFADLKEYISELGNYICEKYDVDIAAMINPGRREMSYRTTRTDLNLALQFAGLYGGGGHAQSAGNPIPEKLTEYFIKNVFDKEYIKGGT